MEAKWKKIRELNLRREDSKRKLLEAMTSFNCIKGKLSEDEELSKQILADVMIQQEIEIPSWDSTVQQMKDQLEESENRLIFLREQLSQIRDDRYSAIFQQIEQYPSEELRADMEQELKIVSQSIDRLKSKESWLRALHRRKVDLASDLEKSRTFWNCLHEKIREYDEARTRFSTKIFDLSGLKNELKNDYGYGGDPELADLESTIAELESEMMEEKRSKLKNIRFLDITSDIEEEDLEFSEAGMDMSLLTTWPRTEETPALNYQSSADETTNRMTSYFDGTANQTSSNFDGTANQTSSNFDGTANQTSSNFDDHKAPLPKFKFRKFV
jgi:hypothetical protein